MAEITDVHGFSKKLQNAYSRLEASNVLDEDKKILKKFGMSLRRENIKKATISNYIFTGTWICTTFVELGINKPLSQIDQDDFDELLIHLEDNKKLSKGTIKTYIIFMKKFSKFIYEDQPKWIRDMRVPKVETSIQPSSLPTKEEFEELLESVTHPRNKALIAVMADAGFRIGGLLSCLIGGVVHGVHGTIIYLNPEGTNKTTAAKGIPLTWSTGHLNKWLDVHPYKNDQGAPLWVTIRKKSPIVNGKHDHTLARYEPLSYDAAYTMIKELQKDLTSQKNIHPHLFRHIAITNWILDGLTDQQVNRRAGWGPTSKEMYNVYGNWTDKEMIDGIYEHYGLKTEDVRKVALKKCPRCNNILKQDDRFCSQCNLPLSMDALQKIENYESQISQILEVFGKLASGQVTLDEIKEHVQKEIKKE